MIDLDELERVADAATQGMWCANHFVDPANGDGCEVYCPGALEDEIVHADGDLSEGNATHIATFDPQTALALIAEVRRLRETLQKLKPLLMVCETCTDYEHTVAAVTLRDRHPELFKGGC